MYICYFLIFLLNYRKILIVKVLNKKRIFGYYLMIIIQVLNYGV